MTFTSFLKEPLIDWIRRCLPCSLLEYCARPALSSAGFQCEVFYIEEDQIKLRYEM